MDKKKILIILAAVFVTIGVGFVAAHQLRQEDKPQFAADGINYNPPTETEKEAGDEQKANIKEEPKPDTGSQPEEDRKPSNATVIITDANQYENIVEVRAFIQDHYEDGTCTITFTRGSSKVSKSTPAYRDASTTVCTNPLFERSEFNAAGDWQVTVAYESSKASGVSEVRTVTLKP